MYKFFFAILIVLVVGFFLYLNFVGSLVNPVTAYNSVDFNVSFNTIVTYTPNPSPQDDSIVITRPVVGNKPVPTADIVIRRFSQSDNTPPLADRINQYFRSPIFNKTSASGAASNGLFFAWNGTAGAEKGFGFDCGSYVCLVLTEGYSSADASLGKEFDTVTNSIKVTSF